MPARRLKPASESASVIWHFRSSTARRRRFASAAAVGTTRSTGACVPGSGSTHPATTSRASSVSAENFCRDCQAVNGCRSPRFFDTDMRDKSRDGPNTLRGTDDVSQRSGLAVIEDSGRFIAAKGAERREFNVRSGSEIATSPLAADVSDRLHHSAGRLGHAANRFAAARWIPRKPSLERGCAAGRNRAARPISECVEMARSPCREEHAAAPWRGVSHSDDRELLCRVSADGDRIGCRSDLSRREGHGAHLGFCSGVHSRSTLDDHRHIPDRGRRDTRESVTTC